MHFVYILYSPGADKYYIGQTPDMEKRMIFHNELGTGFTSKHSLLINKIPKLRPNFVFPSQSSLFRSRKIKIGKQADPCFCQCRFQPRAIPFKKNNA